MDETQITTVAQLDAALAAQHDQRIARLRRIATLPFHWFLVLPFLGIVFNVGAYVVDRHASSLVNTFLMVFIGISCYGSARKKKLQAQAELEKALGVRK